MPPSALDKTGQSTKLPRDVSQANILAARTSAAVVVEGQDEDGDTTNRRDVHRQLCPALDGEKRSGEAQMTDSK